MAHRSSGGLIHLRLAGRIGPTGFDRIEANGRQMVSTWTVFDHEPGLSARWTLDSEPIRGTGGYICEPVDSGTRFTLEAHVKPTRWYRLLGPIFGLIGRKHEPLRRAEAEGNPRNQRGLDIDPARL